MDTGNEIVKPEPIIENKGSKKPIGYGTGVNLNKITKFSTEQIKKSPVNTNKTGINNIMKTSMNNVIKKK